MILLILLTLSFHGVLGNVGASDYDHLSLDIFDDLSANQLMLEKRILDAKSLLISLDVPESNLCRTFDANGDYDNLPNDALWHLPLCDIDNDLQKQGTVNSPFVAADDYLTERKLQIEEEAAECDTDEEISFKDDPTHFLINAASALLCVTTAALAAGLTMGLLSIDPLMLLVKIKAAKTEEERAQAEAILPIVKQHHFLLCTLLLLNSLANEALPIFLEKLVSPLVSILLAVTFLLIFGEIIPSAIFTGPQKLKIAANLIPLVKLVMCLLYPVAYPISKVLDAYLHEDGEDGAFDRGEISALVRIQYEERIANKRERKLARMNTKHGDQSFPHPKPRDPDIQNVMKSVKRHSSKARDSTFSSDRSIESIHMDEVMMVEGALQMKTKTAFDVFTPIHRMFAIPENLILNEDSIVDIYSSGYSRIPVYEQDPLKPKRQTAIKGILITKHLIVVNMSEERPLLTMPLLIPPCVSPKMNLVELVNLFQTGRSGHFALVCARPHVANNSLRNGDAVPSAAGVMGIITLEDVLEELLQEEIYDENDQMEKEAEKIALWVGKKWRHKMASKKRGEENLSLASAVTDIVCSKKNEANESSFLLNQSEQKQPTSKGYFNSIFGW